MIQPMLPRCAWRAIFQVILESAKFVTLATVTSALKSQMFEATKGKRRLKHRARNGGLGAGSWLHSGGGGGRKRSSGLAWDTE